MTRRAIGEGRKRMVISVRQAERERERECPNLAGNNAQHTTNMSTMYADLTIYL